MFCKNCGKQIADESKFCGYCGSTVEKKKVCPSCGHELEADMVYCSFCGSRTDAVRTGGGMSGGTGTAQAATAQTGTYGYTGQAATAQPNTSYTSQASTVQPAASYTNQASTVQPNTNYTNQAYAVQPNTYNNTSMSYGQNMGALKSVEVSWFTEEVKAIGFTEASGILTIYPNRLELKKKMGSTKSYLVGGVIGLAISASKAKKEAPVIFQMNQIANLRESKYAASVRIILDMKNGETNMFVANKKHEQEFHECAALIRANMR